MCSISWKYGNKWTMSRKTILKSSKKRILICDVGQRTFNLSTQKTSSSGNGVSSEAAARNAGSRVYSINLRNDVSPVMKKRKSKKNVTLSPKVPKYKFPRRTQIQIERNNKNQLSSSNELLNNHSDKTAKGKKFSEIPVQNKNKKTTFSGKNLAFSSEGQKGDNFQRQNGQTPLDGFTKEQKLIQSETMKIFASGLEDDDQSWCETNSCMSQAYDNLDMIVSQQPSNSNNVPDKNRNCKSGDNQLLNQPESRNGCMISGKAIDSGKLTKEMNCDDNSKSGTVNGKAFNKLNPKRNQSTKPKQDIKNTTSKFVDPRRSQINNNGNSLSNKPNFQHSKNKSNSNINKQKPKKSWTFPIGRETHPSLGDEIHDQPQVEATTKQHPCFALKQKNTKVGRSVKKCDSVSKSKDTVNSKKPEDASVFDFPSATFKEQDIPINIFEYNSSPVKRNIQRRVRRMNDDTKKTEEVNIDNFLTSCLSMKSFLESREEVYYRLFHSYD
ncbi:putative uncharacterized protein DDB_G0282133 [Octopus bimaculoides]|uniref:putative uncharacterized protein DDB_G0282133 n=1 Tax=Octopus bimaculoides TaxID=37653 RepID=UPI0022E66310|nr:putative uncharacterized protein DDB_G0282133 [Octopus bimaculoides]